jgi:hypothetical protein
MPIVALISLRWKRIEVSQFLLEIEKIKNPQNPACPIKFLAREQRSGFNRGKSCLKIKIPD